MEWSNEVWNWGFTQSQWNDAWAGARGLSYIEGYAHRTAEIALLFEEVFGAGALNDRVRVVSCWQIGWDPADHQFREQMQYIEANFGPPADLIWGLGVAPYYNAHASSPTASPQEILEEMRQSADEGVAARSLVLGVAEEFGLPGGLLAYEGGPDNGGGSTDNVANRILANRDAGMGSLIEHDLTDNWFDVGGGLFMSFTLLSSYDRYGCWGLTDDVTDADRNHQFGAIRSVMDQVD